MLLVMKRVLLSGKKTPASWAKGWGLRERRSWRVGIGPMMDEKPGSWVVNPEAILGGRLLVFFCLGLDASLAS